jgi:hypothetical protein
MEHNYPHTYFNIERFSQDQIRRHPARQAGQDFQGERRSVSDRYFVFDQLECLTEKQLPMGVFERQYRGEWTPRSGRPCSPEECLLPGVCRLHAMARKTLDHG